MNPFFNKPDNVTNDIADLLGKNKQARIDAIPDTVRNAAKAAGSELKGMGKQPNETRTTVYNKHLSKAVGNDNVTPNTRQSFETMADQEYNSPTDTE
jgi:hypothetical protein